MLQVFEGGAEPILQVYQTWQHSSALGSWVSLCFLWAQFPGWRTGAWQWFSKFPSALWTTGEGPPCSTSELWAGWFPQGQKLRNSRMLSGVTVANKIVLSHLNAKASFSSPVLRCFRSILLCLMWYFLPESLHHWQQSCAERPGFR